MKKKIPAILSIVFIFAILFSFAGCVFVEEEEETTTYTALSPLPTEITSSIDEDRNIITDTTYSPENAAKNTVTILEYALPLMNELKSEPVKASVKMSQDKNIGKVTVINENGEEESAPMSENAVVNAAITSLKDYMLKEDGKEITYKDSLADNAIKDFLPVSGEASVIGLTPDDFEFATCVDNGTERVITMMIKNDGVPSVMEERISKVYDKEDVDAILKEFDSASDYMTVGTPELTYKNCSIVLKIDNQTDTIVSIEYFKSVDVSVEITGVGSLSEIGKVPVQFNYTDKITYTIDETNPDETTTLAEK